jgi:aminopeptidase YwaD
MRRTPRAVIVPVFALLAVACPTVTPDPVEPYPVTVDVQTKPDPPYIRPAEISEVIGFLADDEQRGRAPGTDADIQVQSFIAERMADAGLEPYLEGSYLQHFEVGDGVRVQGGRESSFTISGGEAVPYALVPFGHDTGGEPVKGKLVFVNYGIPGEGDDAGDFAGVDLKGSIAVALVGSIDPHADPAKTRPQAKLIAARDRGAVGFILWDPNSDTPFPNRGQYSDLQIPAVFVGMAGTPALRKAWKVRGNGYPKLGSKSRTEFEMATPIEPLLLTTANVIGWLPGSADAGERKRIIIGAHMDHLGLGTASSLAPGEQAIHNGADDNASGVAVLLALADEFSGVMSQYRPHDLVFVAFGAEEMGLLGSKHMLEKMSKEERASVLAMLNFDMVGRLGDKLIVNGTGTAQEWPAILEAANESKLQLESVPDGWGPSDHAAFYGEGMPVLHFFTGAHEDYHKPSDDVDKINDKGAAEIGEFAARVTFALLERSAPLTFVKVDRPTQERAAFKVSLGTMPDYGKDVDGLALAGVSEGGPAAAAGLQKGDIIKRIGTREVHNIDDYMACFGELEPGVEVEVEFEREGARQTAKLVPAAPKQQ